MEYPAQDEANEVEVITHDHKPIGVLGSLHQLVPQLVKSDPNRTRERNASVGMDQHDEGKR